MDNLIYLANIILGLIGFGVAIKIRFEKATQKPMVCPLNMKCEQVLYSKYAKFLGIPMELLGIFYYSFVVISYSSLLIFPILKNPPFIFALFLTSAFGFLFSAYLISVQAFKIREWCSWCLMSAGISTLIFALSLQSQYIITTFGTMAAQYQDAIILTYALAISIGLGLAITLEILFIRFLRDSRISNEESSVLQILRQLTWLAFGVMLIANYALYTIAPYTLEMSPKFIIKIVILSILALTSLIYDLFISSRLVEIYAVNDPGELHIADQYLKFLPFLFGPISVISWFAIFILEMTKDMGLSIIQLSFLYLMLLAASTFIGIIIGIRTVRRA